MNPNHGERVYKIFEVALRCDPAGRTALLDTLCGDDRELRAEVERLLADDERASRDRFLTDPAPPGQGDQGHRPGLLGLRGLDIHILCPHCRNAIELIGLTAADVVCPACGSTFRLERESTASWGLRGDQRKLGRFELIEAVGVGAFGTVYKARDPQLDRTVAMKVPRAGNLASDEDRDRFLREARSVAQLSHAGIVPVHEVGEHEGLPYLVSDFVGGLTLADLLTGRRPPPREAACLVAEVADALQYAHGRGVIHRDIKPSNVMIDDEGRPHLMDFGLAKREAGEVTMTLDGQVLGTPAYMSPEQAGGEGHRVDGRSDIYSLGVLLYELLTGELPFRGNTRMLLHQVLHDEPRPPRSLNDRVPRDLETVCLKAMAKEPNRRYATARDLADDLRRFSSGEPIRARPVGRIEKTWRWCRRNTSLAVASSLAIAALVAVAVISLVFAVEQTKAKNQNQNLADNLESSLNKSKTLAGELKTSLKESERRLAVLNFERGHAACEKGEMGPGLLRLVESWRSAVAADDPGWRHTARASLSAWQGHHARLRALLSHAGVVSRVAFSPDGKTVLTGSNDKTARLWDASTGVPLGPPMTHLSAVSAVAFSPDGKTVLTGSADNTARLWDAATVRPLGPPMTHQDWVYAVAFSPDGKTVLTGSYDNTARLWDAATVRPLGPPITHQRAVHAVAFSPDGKTVLTGSADNTARLWDAATVRPLGPPMTHQDAVYAVAFSPDGKTVLTGSYDKTARLWDAATVRPLGPPMTHQGSVSAVAFSPDGKTVLTGSYDKTARLWDAATVRPLGPPMTHQRGVSAVAFSPDGKTVLTGSYDNTARLWDAATVRPLGPPMTHRDAVSAVAFSPDGKTVLTGSYDKTARLWDAATVRPLGPPMTHQGSVSAVAFSPDGKTVLTGSYDNTARLWDAATVRPLGSPMTHQGAVFVAFSPDGKTVLTGSHDSTARLWDAATVRPLGPPMTHQRGVSAVAFSPDGKTILTGSGDKTARLWDVSELPDNQERISTWVEVITGLELDEFGSVNVLNNTTWPERREKLETQGGPPTTGPRWSLDPILFGPDPTARARAWMERKRWAEAEAAFDEAVAARPLDTAILLERARFLAAHSPGHKADDDFTRAYILGNREPALLATISSSGSLFHRIAAESAGSAAPLWASSGESLAKRQLWTEAAADCGEALRLEPENLAYRHHQILALLAAGDHYGLHRTGTDMLDRFGMSTGPMIANSVAWSSVMAVSEEPNLSKTVRLAEFAVNGAPEDQKAGCLNTLGAALYRAGRFADAVSRLDEGIRYKRVVSDEADWVFLAMAHHRLGHHDEARRWLDRFRNRSPGLAPGDFWSGLEIRLLRTEAEAVVLWDPIFPVDPFAS